MSRDAKKWHTILAVVTLGGWLLVAGLHALFAPSSDAIEERLLRQKELLQ